jgi:hypothetical protein
MSDKMFVKKSQIYGNITQGFDKQYRPACNLIVECIYFSSTAWIEHEKKRVVTKGNLTE